MERLRWIINNGRHDYKNRHEKNMDLMNIHKVCIDYSTFWAALHLQKILANRVLLSLLLPLFADNKSLFQGNNLSDTYIGPSNQV
jgi:hypothetical protein